MYSPVQLPRPGPSHLDPVPTRPARRAPLAQEHRRLTVRPLRAAPPRPCTCRATHATAAGEAQHRRLRLLLPARRALPELPGRPLPAVGRGLADPGGRRRGRPGRGRVRLLERLLSGALPGRRSARSCAMPAPPATASGSRSTRDCGWSRPTPSTAPRSPPSAITWRPGPGGAAQRQGTHARTDRPGPRAEPLTPGRLRPWTRGARRWPLPFVIKLDRALRGRRRGCAVPRRGRPAPGTAAASPGVRSRSSSTWQDIRAQLQRPAPGRPGRRARLHRRLVAAGARRSGYCRQPHRPAMGTAPAGGRDLRPGGAGPPPRSAGTGSAAWT